VTPNSGQHPAHGARSPDGPPPPFRQGHGGRETGGVGLEGRGAVRLRLGLCCLQRGYKLLLHPHRRRQLSLCTLNHRYENKFESLPHDQGGDGRHRCAGCAYEEGFRAGKLRQENVSMSLDDLPESQAGTVRHKSPHAAWALGYLDGVWDSYGSVRVIP